MKIINVELSDERWEQLKAQATTERRAIRAQAATYLEQKIIEADTASEDRK